MSRAPSACDLRIHVDLDFAQVLVTRYRANLGAVQPAWTSRIRHSLRRPWLRTWRPASSHHSAILLPNPFAVNGLPNEVTRKVSVPVTGSLQSSLVSWMQRHRDQLAAGAAGLLRLEVGELAVPDMTRPDPHHVGSCEPRD